MTAERIATIRELDDDSVTVEIAMDSACGSCSSRTHCGSKSARIIRLPLAACDAFAAGRLPVTGERVRLMSDLPVIRAGLLGYLLPVLALIAGATAGQIALVSTAEANAQPLIADLGAAAGALLGLVGALVALRRRDRGLRLRLAPVESRG
ncbi:MAG TPA: SoxR reducing system RseC family protein [Rhodocyclaceae bacterium]